MPNKYPKPYWPPSTPAEMTARAADTPYFGHDSDLSLFADIGREKRKLQARELKAHKYQGRFNRIKARVSEHAGVVSFGSFFGAWGFNNILVVSNITKPECIRLILREFILAGFHQRCSPTINKSEGEWRFFFPDDIELVVTLLLGQGCERVQVGVEEKPVYEIRCSGMDSLADVDGDLV